MKTTPVAEIVKWRGAADVTDQQMIKAVDGILPDLQTLPGFISQTLYKDDEGVWVDLYFWETAEQAIASNDLMAGRASFTKLLSLVEIPTITIEIFHPQG